MTDTSICYCDENTDIEELKQMLLSRNKEWIKKKDGSNSVNDSLKTIVLSCVDSRVPVEKVFDAKPGELLVLKNAGNVITEDILRSLLVAIYELEAKFFIVLGHTRCGMSILGNEEKIAHLSEELGDTLTKLREKTSKDQRGRQTVMVCINDCIDGNSRRIRSRQSSGPGSIQAGRLIGPK